MANFYMKVVKLKFLKKILVLLAFITLIPNISQAAAEIQSVSFPLWSIIPFVGILLSIAICPLINMHWWEENMGKISLFWAMLFVVPSGALFGLEQAWYELLHIMVVDYIPFIVLVAGLFVVAGGINVAGNLPNTPLANSLIILLGTCLASIVGTTGATMLVIRPLINANANRKMKVHTIVFLLFLVSNIGGSLTPVGDPPLFLGFLHGVPFFWTLNLFLPWLFNVSVLLSVYFILDSFFYKRENNEFFGKKSKTKLNGFIKTCFSLQQVNCDKKEKVTIRGLHNLIFLAGILLAVILSGAWAHSPMFYDKASDSIRGITLMIYQGHAFKIGYLNLARDIFIIVMALASLKFTSKEIRQANRFNWMPVQEVGLLFAGIFATIVPALKILQERGAELGVTTPAQFFWATGILSSFLDNAPTYLVFVSIAGQMGETVGVFTDLGMINEKVLLAISCGSVFMGANTYIGNAPNFMTKSIAEENGIKMPSFFGYMLWSGVILIPLFLLNTVLFFK